MTQMMERQQAAPIHEFDDRPVTVAHPDSPLSGPEGHPFHPILVTIPIGAWVCSLVFDVASRISNDPSSFSRGAMWLIVIGVVGAALAAVFGLLDLRTIPAGTKARSVGLTHLTLNSLAVSLFGADVLLRNASWVPFTPTPWWAIALTLLALAVTGASGYLGGKLAYHYGVRVAGPRRQAEGYETDPGTRQ